MSQPEPIETMLPDVQHFLLVGSSVYAIDFEGTTFLTCVCPNRTLAEMTIGALSRDVGVQAKQSNLDAIPGVTMSEFDTRN